MSNTDTKQLSSSGSAPLHFAVGRLEIQQVRDCLASGTDINARNADGNTPLHCCLQKAWLLLEPLDESGLETVWGIMSVLIDHGADVNARNAAGNTPLHFAVTDVLESAVDRLLGAGADVNAVNKAGLTPLQLCFRHALENNLYDDGYEAYSLYCVYSELCKAGAHCNPAQFAPEALPHLLHAVIDFNDHNGIRTLSAIGADINACDNYGRKPIHHAARKANHDTIRALVEAGADVNDKDRSGLTPLDHALRIAGEVLTPQEIVHVGPVNYEALAELLRAGAKAAPAQINRADQNGRPLIHKVVAYEDSDCLEQLLLAGADPDALCQFNFTPLYTAIRHGSHSQDICKCVSLLIDHGADFLHDSGDHPVPLAMAVMFNSKIADMLIERGADLRAADKRNGNTVLHSASAIGCPDVPMPELLDILGSAFCNARNHTGRTPLHCAVSNGQYGNAKLLLAAGARLDAMDNDDLSPLLLALIKRNGKKQARFRKTADVLLQAAKLTQLHLAVADQDINRTRALLTGKVTTDPDALAFGQSALHWAVRLGALRLTHLLLQHPAVNPDVRDWRGRTPLDYAMAQADIELVDSLLNAGASATRALQELSCLYQSLDYASNRNCRHVVTKRIRREVCQRMLSEYVARAVVNDNGDRLLHYLCRHSAPTDDIRLLVANGAEVNARNDLGETPLLVTLKRSTPVPFSTLDALFENNADVMLSDNDGDTPLMAARRRADSSNLEPYLLKQGAG